MLIGPLRDTSLRDLESVFREEVERWDKDLFWDYRPTLSVVKTFVRAGTLPGLVLRDESGQVFGYSYFVVDREVAFIGDVFIVREAATPENYELLIGRTCNDVTSLRHVLRIESQVMTLRSELSDYFLACSFKVVPRSFMVADLKDPVQLQEKPNQVSVERWNDRFFSDCAEAVFSSYTGSPDLELCRDYQSFDGCSRFIQNLIYSPACGRFHSHDTLVAIDSDGTVCGLLIATRIREDTGMIPQLSVRRDFQGRGIGSYLLALYKSEAQQQGLSRVSLSVSNPNHRAIQLYQRFGFHLQREFNAFIWEREA